MTHLIAYLLSAMGITILIVWPEAGPGASFREMLRRKLPSRFQGVLDCYVCLSFWTSLALTPIWWWQTREFWVWAGCVMTPALFWALLNRPSPPPAGPSASLD